MATQKPYGMWSSPISAKMLSQRLRLSEVIWGGEDGRTLFWVEGRSGQGVLVSRTGDDAPRDLTAEHSVRGGVGYGGGELAAAGEWVIFADRGGRLYRRPAGKGLPRPLTPPFGAAASPAISPDGRWVAYVYSDGNVDLLALVDSEGERWPVKLAQGADFYMQPVWHPDRTALAWVEWDHPNMPWNATRICLGKFSPATLSLSEWVTVAAEPGRAAVQPRFSPDGTWLSYLAGSGEWEDLVLLDLRDGEKKVLVHGDGFHLALPAWVQGIRDYDWSPDGESIYYFRHAGGQTTLWEVDVNSGESRQIDTGRYTWLSQISVSPHGELAMLASSPQIPDRVVRWDGEEWYTVARSEGEWIDEEYLSYPKPVTWTSTDGQPVHGLYYPPANPNFGADGPPPALFHVHGGPTSSAWMRYNPEAAYYTSRGYAWVEVNYRGSSGYGCSYQQALNERWGELDVEDTVSGVRGLAEQGLVDPNKAIIIGGSAGGYTVLNALARHPGTFKAGVCLYGVSNLFTLAMDTHKFEERYTDQLVGPLPEAAGRYHDWSPVFHASQIRDPLIIFQGADDQVVPPSQSEEIVAALKASGVPHEYHVYPGEGHGFRRSETLLDYYQKIERFLLQYVLFAA